LTIEISGIDISEKGLNCLHMVKQLVEKYFSAPKNSTFNCFEILKKTEQLLLTVLAKKFFKFMLK